MQNSQRNFRKYFLLLQILLWTTVLVAGALIALKLSNRDYVTLYPNLNRRILVEGNNLPGIHGLHHITTDEQGFRVTRKINYQSKAPLRIFAIGGSTTESIYLDDQKTWTHLLQQALSQALRKNIEVINTGVSGLRTQNFIATLRKVKDLHPDLIIIAPGVNDWNRHIMLANSPNAVLDINKHSFMISKAMLKQGRIMIKQKFAELKRRWIARPDEVVIERGEYYSSQRNSLGREKKLSFRPLLVSQEYEKDLTELATECHKHTEIRCVLITQPNGYRKGITPEYAASFWMTPPNSDYTLDLESMGHVANLYNQFLVSFAKKQRLELCDFANTMPASFDSFYDEVHFNEQGSRRFADELSKCLLGIL